MNKKQQRYYYQAIFNRQERGINTEALEEILRLNRRAVASWERQNTCETSQEYYDKQDRIQENAWNKAEAIATANGWKLDSNGLWWNVLKDGQDIALPVY